MSDEPTPKNLAPAAFAGTADDYARYRPPYPRALIEGLLGRVSGRERALDLACGPGRVAFALSPEFGEVVAVDSELDMVETGRRLARERGSLNLSWHCTRAEAFHAAEASFDLVTIGEAFHRLDQVAVRRAALRWLKPGGVLATMGCGAILRGTQAWQVVVRELAVEWTREMFPNGWAPAREGALTQPGELAGAFEAAGFIDVANHTYIEARDWTIDEIAGYLRSTSICSPSVLGAKRGDFEAALGSALRRLNPDGVFHEDLDFGLTVARRPE
jgi:SAM-dependent methyltransferase